MENKMLQVKDEIKKAVKGKDEVVEKVLAAMLAGGHVLVGGYSGGWQDHTGNVHCKIHVLKL